MSNIFDKILDPIEEYILSYSIIIMAVVLVINVFFRSVLNHSLTWSEEIGQFLVIVNTFAGISYGAKKARHISMSALFDIVPERIKKVFMFTISGVTSAIMFYLGYLAIIYTHQVFMIGRVSPALRIPMWLFYIFVPIGFIIGGIQYARTFYKNAKEKDVYLSEQIKLGEAGGDETWS